MATVNFYLKGALSDKRIEQMKKEDNGKLQAELKQLRQIYLKVSVNGERLQIYTKKRIAQYHWNKGKQEADCKRFKIGGIEFNEWLNELRNDVLKLANTLELEGKRITQKDLENALSGKSIKKISKLTIEDCEKDFLSNQKTKQGHSLKPSTKKKYGSFFIHLKNFHTSTRKPFDLSRIEINWLKEFKDFLINQTGICDNTVSRYIRQAKAFVNYYISKGEISSFEMSSVKAMEREKEVFILQIGQILDLQKKEIKLERLARVRDIFCFMCWTGQRFSDIMELKHSDIIVNVHGEKYWHNITNKTEDFTRVPIIPYAQEILSKYRNYPKPLPQITNEKMNEYLKELGDLMEFNEGVKKVKYYDGIRKEQSLTFRDILTTHIARKSYITNSLILGVPERIVKQVSQHKDDKSFRRYVKLAESFIHNQVKNAYSPENIAKFA